MFRRRDVPERDRYLSCLAVLTLAGLAVRVVAVTRASRTLGFNDGLFFHLQANSSLTVPASWTPGGWRTSKPRAAEGLGAIVTQAAMDAARTAGAQVAVLQASEMGRRVYERLGFDTVAAIAVHVPYEA